MDLLGFECIVQFKSIELSEYLEQENHEYFWALMDHLAELDDLPTGDKQGYEKMMEWTSR